MRKALLAAVTATVMVMMSAGFTPASAEWLTNPVSGEDWYCDWYYDPGAYPNGGSNGGWAYECYVPHMEQWILAAPDWQQHAGG